VNKMIVGIALLGALSNHAHAQDQATVETENLDQLSYLAQLNYLPDAAPKKMHGPCTQYIEQSVKSEKQS
jgi:hypothetical protein